VLGFGWQRGRGVKGGSIIDLEEAERAIRAAVGQAEEMSDTQLRARSSTCPAASPIRGCCTCNGRSAAAR
jgi:cell division protein FtsA